MVQTIEREGISNNIPENKIQKIQGSLAIQKTMNVLHITTTDPAGAGYNLVRALNEHTDVRARIITTHPNVFGHPDDISTVFDQYDEFESLLLDADVVHFHKVDETFEVKTPDQSSRKRSWRISDFLNVGGKHKKKIYHVHGHPYERAHVRENALHYAKLGSRVLTATPDLELAYNANCNASYFPNCVPVNDIRYLPRATNKMMRGRDGKDYYFIGHTVSTPHLKNVKEISNVVSKLGQYYPVRYFRISDMKFETAIKIKRHCHIIFDHMQGYYGLGSLEGFSMGKPVIAGLNDYCLKRICEFFDCWETPWQIARTENEIRDAITDMICTPEMMIAIGIDGRTFMEDVWNDKFIAGRLAEIYKSL